MDILKAILGKIASWFQSEEKTVEARIAVDVKAIEQDVAAVLSDLCAAIKAVPITSEALGLVKTEATTNGRVYVSGINGSWRMSNTGTLTINADTTTKESSMSTPAADQAAPANMNPTVDTAIQIALALKAIDPSLTTAAVQAATNAALAAAYPVPAAAAPAA
ncbi:hypothetical protein WK60_13975 [Burkholderia ubonensis]|uniref:hypothetical protein n=1 Tax=Burkholderia ubonensis TaxID=101571 RepID=UPI000757497D|nr:hypothetical protein [Burkholderia ubonensis]KVT92693.1 hypothetical protein WK60_13975 [Burkholderia ubonensis]